MTGHDDFDRTLANWFEADALSPAPAERLDRVLDATRRRRPRPAWLSGLGSDWVGEAPDAGSGSGARSLPHFGVRWSTALALLLVIVALIGGAILVGARLFQHSPLPTGRLGHLAYGIDGDIYVADWDGSNPVRIADGPPIPPSGDIPCASYGGEGPMWSPDGRYLAYRLGGACPGSTVVISDPTGHVVASFPGTGWRVAWSPDSTRVATTVELGKTFGIYGLDGVRQALLTMPSGYDLQSGDYDPTWSPDGMALLMPIAPIAPIAPYGPSGIWELPIDGGTPRRVPDGDPRSHREVGYSRDGASTAFIDYPHSASLVIANANGTDIRVLAGAWGGGGYGLGQGEAYRNPVVSPTGDRVAYTWSPAYIDPSTADLTYELRVVDVASGTVRTLASASGAFVPLAAVRFSPEGDRILFSRTDASGITSLWSVRVDGSDARLLVPRSGWGDWQWLPAGS